MATLRLGHYNLDNNPEYQHTYARLSMTSGDDYPVKFYCNGSVYSSKNHIYPANFCQYDGKSFGTEFSCNGTTIKQLACWSHDKNVYDRTTFDRSTDCTDLLYGIAGVCHQMCNTLIVPITPEGWGWNLFNYTSSLKISIQYYGYRGLNWGRTDWRDDRIREFLSACKSINTFEKYNGTAVTGSAKVAIDKTISDINEQSNAGVSNQLNNGYDYNTFDSTVGMVLRDFNLWDKISERDDFNNLVSTYLASINNKNEYDNLLIRGQISNDDYANKINELMTKYQLFLYEYLAPEDYSKLIGTQPEDMIVIDKTAMPETYENVRERLTLR